MPKNVGGNVFEMQHRPFLITYLLVLLWAAGLTLSFARSKMRVELSPSWKLGGKLLTLLLLFGLQFNIPTIVGVPGREQLNTAFPRGLYEVSKVLEMKHSKTDRFLDSGLDPAEFIIAVSETRSFLSRPDRRSITGNSGRALLYRDLKLKSQDILAESNPGLFLAKAKSEGIRWVIAGPEDSFGWREELEPTYTNRGYSLYDLAGNSYSH
jgi:hypothetical protein